MTHNTDDEVDVEITDRLREYFREYTWKYDVTISFVQINSCKNKNVRVSIPHVQV